MDLRTLALAAAALALVACGERQKAPPSLETGERVTAPDSQYSHIVTAGGAAPSTLDLRNPYSGDKSAVNEGRALFTSMNCDGCHGGGGVGWVGPSLNDGRWRYGGSEGEIYQTVFFGRPRGMPAYGGILPEPIVWKLVTYIRSLEPAETVPTETWK